MRSDNRLRRNYLVWLLFVACAFAGCMFFQKSAVAGESLQGNVESETSRMSEIKVTLRGAERQGTVQIFDYLLGQLPGVIKKDVEELHVISENKQSCVASWNLTVQGINGVMLESELLATIKSLDLKASNDIFYESPFIIVAQDLKMVKEIKGWSSSTYGVVFTLFEGELAPVSATSQQNISSLGNPWLLLPGAGFE